MSNYGIIEGTLTSTFLRGLSAYQEALLTGFEGSRDEWIESLKGHEVLLRQNGYAIEWKYTDDETWTELIRLEPMTDYEVLVNRPTYNDEPLEGEVHTKIFSDDNAISNAEIDTIEEDEGTWKMLTHRGLKYLWSKIILLLFGKVDKVENKQLSTNDYTNEDKIKLESVTTGANVNTIEQIVINRQTITPIEKTVSFTIPTKTSNIQNDLNYPSDAMYVHTDNNYTTAEKEKLANIEALSERNTIVGVNVNGETETPTDRVVYLLIPTKVSDLENDLSFISDANYVHTDNNYTTANKEKLDGIEAGAEVNIIEFIRANGKLLPITDKGVSISFPTKASGIQNDMNYVSDANYIHSDNNFSNEDKSHLDYLWQQYGG